VVRLQSLEKPLISREVVLSPLLFGAQPDKIHPDPAEAPLSEHLHLAGLGIGEMDVDPHPLRDDAGGKAGARKGGKAECDPQDKRDRETHWRPPGKIKVYQGCFVGAAGRSSFPQPMSIFIPGGDAA